jgi:rhamnulokinase
VAEVSVAAVDLGASSGRVMLGRVGPGRLSLREVSRFPNGPVPVQRRLHWDVLRLYSGTLEGLRAAGRESDLAAIGIDSWAVDYGLLDADGELLGNPVHYRDPRTNGVMEKVLTDLEPERLYATTGLQQLPFNTIYQLLSAVGSAQLDAARTMLLIPDLLGYWLTGEVGAEVTNASTTQLYDVVARTWSWDLIRRIGLPECIFPPLREPGDTVGPLQDAVVERTGLHGAVPVVAVGSHDTASAVVAVPASGEQFAYVSCGTWSLVGLELDRPVLTEASRLANFTNEGGVDGRIRYLRNVMGLWLLQETLREWTAAGLPADLTVLLQDAARVASFTAVVDPDHASFLPPGDMPTRIAAYCRATGQDPPQSQAGTVRCILDSLALAHRRALRLAQELSGHAAEVVHVVGGGARNALLCQLTADACGLPVLAGPVEAAAVGNVLVQARALGAVPADLGDMRGLVGATHALQRYEPRGNQHTWDRAEARLTWGR